MVSMCRLSSSFIGYLFKSHFWYHKKWMKTPKSPFHVIQTRSSVHKVSLEDERDRERDRERRGREGRSFS